MNYDEKKAELRELRGGPRYAVVSWSVSAHCCFDATVLDTKTEHDHSNQDAPSFHQVCECFENDDAMRIAKLLNEAA